MTDAEIIDNVRCISEDTKEHTDAPKGTTNEAEKTGEELVTKFLESQGKVAPGGFNSLANLRILTKTKKVRRKCN